MCVAFFSSGGEFYCICDGCRESFSNKERNMALRVRDEMTNLEAGEGGDGGGAGAAVCFLQHIVYSDRRTLRR